MTEKNDGGPAFPVVGENGPYGEGDFITVGMSLRAYAAIKLKQPDSGIDWLDEMILKTKRDEVAAKAMQGLVIQWGEVSCEGYDSKIEIIPKRAYEMADSMLKAGEEK